MRWSLSEFLCKTSAKNLPIFKLFLGGAAEVTAANWPWKRDLVLSIASGAIWDGCWSMELMECAIGLAFHHLHPHIPSQQSGRYGQVHVWTSRQSVSLCEVKCFGKFAVVSIILHFAQNPIGISWIGPEPSLSFKKYVSSELPGI